MRKSGFDVQRGVGVNHAHTLGSVSKHCQASAMYSICLCDKGILQACDLVRVVLSSFGPSLRDWILEVVSCLSLVCEQVKFM